MRGQGTDGKHGWAIACLVDLTFEKLVNVTISNIDRIHFRECCALQVASRKASRPSMNLIIQ